MSAERYGPGASVSQPELAVSWVDKEDWRGFVPLSSRQWLLDHHLVMAWVAGVQFRKTTLRDDRFKPGCRLRVVLEPDNPHDRKAIGLWSADGELQVGYVPRVIGQGLSSVEETRFGTTLWELGPAGSRTGLGVLLSRSEVVLVTEVASLATQRHLARKVRQYQQNQS